MFFLKKRVVWSQKQHTGQTQFLKNIHFDVTGEGTRVKGLELRKLHWDEKGEKSSSSMLGKDGMKGGRKQMKMGGQIPHEKLLSKHLLPKLKAKSFARKESSVCCTVFVQ